MKKFFLKLLLFLPVPFIIASVNLYIDPAHIFNSGKYLENAAEYLHEGCNVANLINYDDRLLQKIYIEKMDMPKDVIVLGSSRSMQISNKLFPMKNFYNNSVSGADIHDLLAIFHLYEKNDLLPKTIVICLDPWVLNGAFIDTRWKSLINEYNEMLSKIGKSYLKVNVTIEKIKFMKKKLTELFSFVYFQSSVNRFNNDEYYATLKDSLDTYILYSDGSFFEYEYSKRLLDEVNTLAKNFNYGSVHSFLKLDEVRCGILDNFFEYLTQKNIKIIGFISPFHPITYNSIISKNPAYNEAEIYFKSLSEKYDFMIYGSMNPNKCNLKEIDFYDGMHLKKEAVNLIFKKSLQMDQTCLSDIDPLRADTIIVPYQDSTNQHFAEKNSD